jgi:hypothetical protein
MKRRAFTITEVCMASAISLIVVGTMAATYNFAVARTAHAFAVGSTTSQIQAFSREVDAVIAQASSVQVVVSGGSVGLRCTMPATPADVDMDGRTDAYLPTDTPGGSPVWGKGKRVWFYMANSTGNFLSPGPILWKAERNDDVFPLGINTIKDFTYVSNSTLQRFSLIDSITWSASTTDKTVTYTVKANALTRSDTKSATSYTTDGSKAQTLALTKTVFFNNWRQ